MNHEGVGQAAYNNAVWCDTVCRAQGRAGEFFDDIWINRRETPRFYPNAVTLSRNTAVQLKYIHDLVEVAIPAGFAVKDSFSTLDLAPFGFRVLLEAEWIWREASRPRPSGGASGARWVRVTGASELADWEMAWDDEPSYERHSPRTRIFLPSLLVDENIAVIAAYQGRRIVAGAIANRTQDVVGVSNIFVPAPDAGCFRTDCVAEVIDAFPGLRIVGYESGGELAGTRALGFEALGPLRVWERAFTR